MAGETRWPERPGGRRDPVAGDTGVRGEVGWEAPAGATAPGFHFSGAVLLSRARFSFLGPITVEFRQKSRPDRPTAPRSKNVAQKGAHA